MAKIEDKTKKKKLKLPIGRIISDNIFMLKLIMKAAPLLLISDLLLSVLNAVINFISNAYLLRYALNGINEGKSFGEIALFVALCYSVQLVYWSVSDAYYNLYYDKRWQDVLRELHRMVYKKATEVELGCYENPDYYDSMAKAIDECARRAWEVRCAVINMIWRITSFSANIGLLIIIDPILLLFVLIPICAAPFQAKKNKLGYERDMETKEVYRRRDYSRRTFYLSDYSKEMRLSGMPHLMLTRFKESGEKIIDIIGKYGVTLAALGYIISECNHVLSPLGATFYAAWQTLKSGSMGYGDCIVVVNSIENVAFTLTNSTGDLLKFQENALYIENLRSFLDYEPKIVDGDKPLPKGGDIVLNGVSFKYDGSDKYVLKNVSMRFGAKEKIAIVGHNGAGKTTLVKLLLRLYDAEGSIAFGDTELRELKVDEYRDIFSSVMQDYHVFALTAAENVLLRRRVDGDDELVVSSLKNGGLYDKVKAFSKGINTVMTKEFDEAGEVLSGGEAQKLAISHVYSKKNRFVILDEPSSALDPIAEHEMYESMTRACSDCGMIFISHRLSSAVMADRIYLMENGEVAETGTHAELLAKNGKYAEMFRKQAENYMEGESEI